MSVPVATRGCVSVRPGGATLYVPTSMGLGGGRRGFITGWSRKAAARHVRWLQSVDPSALVDLHGLAVTLTVRDMPASASAWARARRRWISFARDHGAILGHWVTEWQQRGTPHLHLALFFESEPSPGLSQLLVRRWCQITAAWGARPVGQDVHCLYERRGWEKYQAKHSARSVRHAQRGGMPPGWDRSGRLWGHWGDWVLREDVLVLDGRAWAKLRRMVRSWALADARSERNRAVRAAREKVVRRSLLGVSGLRGVREWCPETVVLRLIGLLIDEGSIVVSREGELVAIERLEQAARWRATCLGFERRNRRR